MVKAGHKLITGLAVLLLTLVFCFTSHAMPDVITMDQLAELYDGVVFDHESHIMMTEGCAVCHHHTMGGPVLDTYCAKCHDGSETVEAVACSDCHSKDRITADSMSLASQGSAFHDDLPDLKGAYHLSCLGCHQEMGAPVGCTDCHGKTEAGDEFYHSGQFAPTQSPQ